MPSGSIYTFIGTSTSSNNIGAIQTSQGVVAVGQYGYFLPNEYLAAVADGCILQAGIAAGASTSTVKYGPAILGSDGGVGGPGGSPLSSWSSVMPVFHVNSRGADPTNTQDSTGAFVQAYTDALASITNGAFGAYIGVGQGAYRLTAGNLNITDPRIGMIGPGRFMSTIYCYGSGDAIKYGTSNFNTRHSGSRMGGFLIDGTNTTGTSNGLHVTDLGDVHYNDLFVTNFTQSSSVGILCDTLTGWSERMLWTGVDVTNNTIGVCFDGGASGTSYDYQQILDLYLGIFPGQTGLLLRNFAQLDQPVLHMRFNAHKVTSSADQTAIVVGPTNNGGETSRIRNAHFAIRGEASGSGSNVFDISMGANTEFTGTGMFFTFGCSAGTVQTKNVVTAGVIRNPGFNSGVYRNVTPIQSVQPVPVVESGAYLASGAGGSTGTGTFSLGSIFFNPIDVGQVQTFSGLSTCVSVLGAGGTTPLIFMGLYPDDGNGTKPVLTNGPVINTLTTPSGFNTQVTSDPTAGVTSTRDVAWSTPQTLVPGRYWCCWILSSGTAMGTNPTIVTLTPSANVGLDALTNVSHRNWQITTTSQISNLPTSGTLFRGGGGWPIMAMKAQ